MGPRRFFASVFGYNSIGEMSTEASRGGSMGVKSHTRGWDLGIEVTARINEDGEDEFDIWTTGGSHDDVRKELVATVNQNGFS